MLRPPVFVDFTPALIVYGPNFGATMSGSGRDVVTVPGVVAVLIEVFDVAAGAAVFSSETTCEYAFVDVASKTAAIRTDFIIPPFIIFKETEDLLQFVDNVSMFNAVRSESLRKSRFESEMRKLTFTFCPPHDSSRCHMNESPFGWAVRTSTKDSALTEKKHFLALPNELAHAMPTRKTEWLVSRMALQTAFAQAGEQVAIHELREASTKSLGRLPELTFSISHTDEVALVWLAKSPAPRSLSIGVDIERANREISHALKRRLRNSGDIQNLSAIALWSAKEAAFKALSSPSQRHLVLSEIVISQNRFTLLSDTTVNGFWRQQTREGFIESYAWHGDLRL